MTATALAPAKINLTLHVTGRRADGYHLLDSIVAFASVGDRLTVGPGDRLTVTGPFAQGVPTDDRNLVRRALAMAGTPRSVELEKILPHPGGIGGGSSDAAVALRLAGASLALDDLLGLGADMPVCALGRAARVRGIGGQVDALDLPQLHAVLVHPGLSLPTPDVFRALDRADNAGHEDIPPGGSASNWLDWLADQRNDLEAPAMTLAPDLADVLTQIARTDASIVRMSGSGATCFGLYPRAEDAADAAEGLQRPGWWVRSCTLG
ncbi:4-(cytidine 5'-diphospho)-2-C-methyl-D-erythritol kinase [Jannaschia sp. S6380]|uniref:4-(cytidine 5'-diphospho)-2-C-methyl-D-erythritol kinase n=1 Tax=Jannaschia sp. S6380 TaxID=2926408 RepID=UPI001FF2CFB6|nr:4-(cytidine 5'-diphospho)-2-C-methyl-D-erythritol kinase [Jannaschia sp. S6380]